MAQGLRWRKTARDGAFALLGLAALGLAAFFWLHVPKERPVRLRLTAGRSAGERYRIAEALRREAARRAIAIEVVETAGTDAALRDVEAGRLDAALAQGGLDVADRPDLRQVASLHVEPLHLLVKEEVHDDVSRRLSALRGKLVGLGERGSGTNRLATEVMVFAGLKPGDFIASNASYAELQSEADRARLPDAVFTVSTLPSPVARHLVATHGFRLVPLPFFEAFTLGAIDEDSGQKDEPGARIERRNVYEAQIPSFAYRVEPGVPPTAIPTLGTRLLLVARKGVPAEAIQRLLEVVYGSPFAQAVQPAIDAKLLDLPPELPWHDGTSAYLRRNAPAIAGDVIDLLEKELSILAALLGGLFFLGQWLRRRFRRRREEGFGAYIVRVAAIERRAMETERAATLDLGTLLGLQEELSRLKGEALDRFADGTLEGEELMSGFLTHVSDARDYLTRLILHQRELIEEQARHEGRRAQDVWREAADGVEGSDRVESASS
ncbi:MAG TPA: TAXI family TRAP transporter solute-binding subunit [Isosphaeraceae bacterium]